MPIPNYVTALEPYQHIPEVTNLLTKIKAAYTSEPIELKFVDELRGYLLRFISNIEKIKAEKSHFYMRLYHSFWQATPLQGLSNIELNLLLKTSIIALKQLAIEHPVNDEDPITHDKFDEVDDDVIFESITGRRYLLKPLALWFCTKGGFIYPDMSIRMSKDDSIRFKAMCEEHKVDYAPLNEYQLQLIEQASAIGLTQSKLKELHAPELRVNHVDALKTLMEQHDMTPEEAIKELKQLNYEQADAITALYTEGLRGDDLRALPFDQRDFLPLHTAVIQYLIEEKDVAMKEAVEIIGRYPSEEVQTVYFKMPSV